MPFVVLIVTKGVVAEFEGILTSTDWSIASFMVIAQCMAFIISNLDNYPKVSKHGLVIFVGITLIFLILCMGIYAYSLSHPESSVSYGQVVMFLFCSVWMMAVYKADDYLKKF